MNNWKTASLIAAADDEERDRTCKYRLDDALDLVSIRSKTSYDVELTSMEQISDIVRAVMVNSRHGEGSNVPNPISMGDEVNVKLAGELIMDAFPAVSACIIPKSKVDSSKLSRPMTWSDIDMVMDFDSKIGRIKCLRGIRPNLGLKEAKYLVEFMRYVEEAGIGERYVGSKHHTLAQSIDLRLADDIEDAQ